MLWCKIKLNNFKKKFLKSFWNYLLFYKQIIVVHLIIFFYFIVVYILEAILFFTLYINKCLRIKIYMPRYYEYIPNINFYMLSISKIINFEKKIWPLSN